MNEGFGTIDARLTAAIARGARSMGATSEALAAAEQLDDQRIAFADHLLVWEAAMRATRLPALPIRLGTAMTVDRYGVLGYALYVAATVGHALARAARFHDVVTDSGKFVVESRGDRVVFAWQRPGARTLGMRVANEQVLASCVKLLETHVGSLPMLEVQFRHREPVDITEHERLFRAPIQFDAAADAIVLPRDYVEQPIPAHDPVLEAYFVKQLDDTAARVGGEAGVAGAVAREILERLPDGIPSASVLGRALGMSERSLRRRLSEANIRLSDLTAALQRDRAESLLDAGNAIGDVAIAVGFSDATAFTRAYRKWTGMPPSRRKR